MSSSSAFCLFTSISPRLGLPELDYQKSCIASWRAAGFDVATVNGHTEVARIEAFGLDVEIVTLGEGGKPRIADILTCARERDGAYAGIVNADCALLPYPELASHIAAQLSGGVAIVERLDIDEKSVPQPDSCSGFDAFFFDKRVVPANFDRSFRIGVPWWDYCFPMAAAVEGARIFNIETPLLTHKVHLHAWNDEERDGVGQIFWRFLRQWRASEPAGFPSLGGELDGLWSEDTLTRGQLGVVGLACFRWLQSCRLEASQPFLPAGLQPVEALFRSQRLVINQLNQRAIETAALAAVQIGELRSANADLEFRLGGVRKQLDAIEGSTSWRLTKPLRSIVAMLGASFRTPEK